MRFVIDKTKCISVKQDNRSTPIPYYFRRSESFCITNSSVINEKLKIIRVTHVGWQALQLVSSKKSIVICSRGFPRYNSFSFYSLSNREYQEFQSIQSTINNQPEFYNIFFSDTKSQLEFLLNYIPSWRRFLDNP